MALWRNNILRFIFLVLLQLLLINNLHLFNLCYPCIYVLFLISLPQTLPRWAELIIGFLTGLIIDIACNSLGVHCAACTAISYIRPLLLQKLRLEKKQILSEPSSKTLGFITYLKLVAFLVILHHTLIFTLSAFTWNNWWITLLQILISSLVSIVLIIGYDSLVHQV